MPADRMHMHELHRTLHSLDAYDHLRCVFRLCIVHNYHRIKSCAVVELVRIKMRSLACIKHPNWDETINYIQEHGGKAGTGKPPPFLPPTIVLTHGCTDWVRDKETCKFAFPGICQEKSFIPLVVWKAGEAHSNLIETVHRDVNREGVHCTVVGGLLRGQAFDALKTQTLLVCLFFFNVVVRMHSSSPSHSIGNPMVFAPHMLQSTRLSTRSKI